MSKYKYTEYINTLKKTLENISINKLEELTDLFLECHKNNKTIYIFGNGGSGATASHVAGDFMKGVSYQLKNAFKVISLNDNMPGIMAIANDLSYDDIFIEQLKNTLKKGDIAIGISGSGNSKNVLKAISFANKKNAITIGFTGYKGGKLKTSVNLSIHAPVIDMEVTEDIHMVIFHALKQQIISKLKGNEFSMGKKYETRIAN